MNFLRFVVMPECSCLAGIPP